MSETRTDVNKLGEFGLIDHLTQHTVIYNPGTIKGVGDDAAVIDASDALTLVTTCLLYTSRCV